MVGDIDANVEKLKAQLRQLRCPMQQFDTGGLFSGNPTSVLPILHYLFVSYSSRLSQFLSDNGHELRSKTDLRFLEEIYRALREHRGYKPTLTTAQFLSPGFAERKVLFCQDAAGIVKRWHADLSSEAMSSRMRRRSAPEPGTRPALSSTAFSRDVMDDIGEEPIHGRLAAWRGDAAPFARCPPQCEAVDSSDMEAAGAPQPPPRPMKLEIDACSVPTSCAQSVSRRADFEESQSEAAYHQSAQQRGLDLSKDVQALQELIESVRDSIESRLDSLEKQVQEQADKSLSMVGEVTTMAARLDGVQSAVSSVKAALPEVFHGLVTEAERLTRPCSNQSQAMSEARSPAPCWWRQTSDFSPEPLELRDEVLATQKAAVAEGSPSSSQRQLPLSMMWQGSLSTPVAQTPVAQPSKPSGTQRGQATTPAATSSPTDKDMLEELSSKFRDTQAFLNLARRRIGCLDGDSDVNVADMGSSSRSFPHTAAPSAAQAGARKPRQVDAADHTCVDGGPKLWPSLSPMCTADAVKLAETLGAGGG
mmetsp:Transcript_54303/g.129405  ORF Transcript_54303/g.129405 Transcript_54303/m.129405 type:complete len:534 (-) Transcript_54303:107-1708(-)